VDTIQQLFFMDNTPPLCFIDIRCDAPPALYARMNSLCAI